MWILVTSFFDFFYPPTFFKGFSHRFFSDPRFPNFFTYFFHRFFWYHPYAKRISVVYFDIFKRFVIINMCFIVYAYKYFILNAFFVFLLAFFSSLYLYDSWVQFLNCWRLLDIYLSPDEIVYNGLPNNKTKIQLYFIFLTHPQLFSILEIFFFC